MASRPYFDVQFKLNQLGWFWRPIQKSSLLTSLGKNMKKSRSFIKQAAKADLVNLNDLVTVFYDHVPTNTGEATTAPFMPHWTCLVAPETGEAFIQAPQYCNEFTQESLGGLLDILEELECTHVYAAVQKGSEDMMNVIRQFMSVGFRMVPPTIKNMPGYVLLGYECL